MNTFAEIVTARLSAARSDATVIEVDGLDPGECWACDTDTDHAACVVVNVAVRIEATEPPTRLDGWSTPCCWERLPAYLAECSRAECVEGLTVEVPIDRWAA